MRFRERTNQGDGGGARPRIGATTKSEGAGLRRFPLSTSAAGAGNGRPTRAAMPHGGEFAAMQTIAEGQPSAPVAARSAGDEARRIAADIGRTERDLKLWIGGYDGDIGLRHAEERVSMELRHARELHEIEARDEAEWIVLEQRQERERAGVELDELALVEETHRREAEWLRHRQSDGLNSLFERQEIERDHLGRLHALQGKRG